MQRIAKKFRSKRAITLVELVVAMTLTAIFAAACVVLIFPVTNIYTHTNNLSRAQILADSVIDALRNECSHTYIKGHNDVWIANSGNSTISSAPAQAGPVLVIRRNAGYCETIFSNEEITQDAYTAIHDADANLSANSSSITTRAIYRLFSAEGDPYAENTDAGYVHFGYYGSDGGGDTFIIPKTYYDFTNPFAFATYRYSGGRAFTVQLNFHDITYSDDGNSSTPVTQDPPAYVMCDVSVVLDGEVVYTRTAVLCFASPVN